MDCKDLMEEMNRKRSHCLGQMLQSLDSGRKWNPTARSGILTTHRERSAFITLATR